MRIYGDAAIDDSRIALGEMDIGVFQGQFAFDQDERSRMIEVCQQVWHALMDTAGADEYEGLVRIDGIPKFSGGPGREYLGYMQLAGMYEVNTAAPECGAAGAMIQHHYPELPSVSAPGLIVREFLRHFGSNTCVTMVVGTRDCPVKREWAPIYANALRASGLDVIIRTPQEVMSDPPSELYLFGDLRVNGESHFDDRFVEWIRRSYDGKIVNSILERVDMGDKGLLLDALMGNGLAYLIGEESRHLHCGKDADWSLEVNEGIPRYKHLVLKPDDGKSGDGVVIGRDISESEWRDEVGVALEKMGFSLWEMRPLPCVRIGRIDYAMDMNPSFWASGRELEYLYTIIRVQPWGRYIVNGTNNVAKGAGLAPVIV